MSKIIAAPLVTDSAFATRPIPEMNLLRPEGERP